MKYTFRDILNSEIYTTGRVIVATGKYEIFNAMVADTVMDICKPTANMNINNETSDEFGVKDDILNTNIVSFEVFMSIVNTRSMNGLWYCRVDLSALTKKQLNKLQVYIKHPSDNGKLVITSTEFKVYNKLLNNKSLMYGSKTHILNLSFPDQDNLHIIAKQMFEDKGKDVDINVVNYFCMRMSKEYDLYEQTIDEICSNLESNTSISIGEIKEEMKGIEYYDLDDFFSEIVKPMSSNKANNKKVLRMIVMLCDQIGAEELVKKTLKMVNEEIDFRIMINSGVIPISIRYLMSDVHNMMNKLVKEEDRGDKFKAYFDMNEWQFRKKADLAAQTSLRDWVVMKLLLTTANKYSKDREFSYTRVLYSLAVRSKLREELLKNDLHMGSLIDAQISELESKYKVKDISNSVVIYYIHLIDMLIYYV